MDIKLVPVTRDNLRSLFRLQVKPEQDSFVARNEFSIAQAAYETATYPFGIEADGVLVGFCQMIDLREYAYRDESDDPESGDIWRFMIGADHQGKGYGGAALEAMMAWSRDRNHKYVTLSVKPENAGAIALYEASGFKPTGREFDGEVEYRFDFKS